MNDEAGQEGRDVATISYRYLRLALVVAPVTLGFALLLEGFKTGRIEGSISAYYFTPVRSIFVGVLCVVCVSLVALSGRDVVEDLLLNLAGFFAAIVALVPTKAPGAERAGPRRFDLDTSILMENNVPALFAGFIFALLLGVGIALWNGGFAKSVDAFNRERERRRANEQWIVPLWSMVGAFISAAVLVGGLLWFIWHRSSFESIAHGLAAGAMFGAIWVAIVLNAQFSMVAGWRKRLCSKLDGHPPRPVASERYRFLGWYRSIALFFVAAVVTALIAMSAGVANWTYWLEVVLIIAFGVYWTLQTIEEWDGDIANPASKSPTVSPT